MHGARVIDFLLILYYKKFTNMKQINSLKKGIDILFSFSSYQPTQSVNEIAEKVGIPRSSTYRFVVSLKNMGLLERDSNGNYSLGLRLLKLEAIVHKRLKIEEIAIPYVKKLANETDETVILNLLLFNRDVVTIFAEESSAALRVAPQRGINYPLHVGASRQVILAFLSPEIQEEFLSQPLKKVTDYTITDPDELRERIKTIRENGYAISHQEVYIGAAGLAVPLFSNDKIIGSIGLVAPLQRFEKEREEYALRKALETAKQISQILP